MNRLLATVVTTDPKIENPVIGDTIEKLVTVWFPESKFSLIPESQVLVPVLDAFPDNVDVPPAALIVVGGVGVHVTLHAPHASLEEFAAW